MPTLTLVVAVRMSHDATIYVGLGKALTGIAPILVQYMCQESEHSNCKVAFILAECHIYSTLAAAH